MTFFWAPPWICWRKASFLAVISWTEGMGLRRPAIMTDAFGMIVTNVTQMKSRTRKLVELLLVRAETRSPRVKKTER
jgi:hypothetical protein